MAKSKCPYCKAEIKDKFLQSHLESKHGQRLEYEKKKDGS